MQEPASTLQYVLETHCSANWFDDSSVLSIKRFLNQPDFPDRSEQFKQELATAILHHTITPEKYERLTDVAYDEQESVDRELHELWQHLYGNEPVMLTNAEATALR